jgi:hypothetical protein
MTDKAISPLRRRLIEDMTIRRLSPKIGPVEMALGGGTRQPSRQSA